ncbi:MAG TPA: hypothetical protein VKV79_01195 [Terriglobia bacterium]|nr:hypothetical protein [Terriglobia bacterium]
MVRVHCVDAFDHLALAFRGAEFVVSVNAFDHQRIPLELNFPSYVGYQFAIACVYAARFQRAAKSSG